MKNLENKTLNDDVDKHLTRFCRVFICDYICIKNIQYGFQYKI